MNKAVLILIFVALAVGTGWYFTRAEPVAVRLAAVERGTVRATVANTRVGTVEALRTE